MPRASSSSHHFTPATNVDDKHVFETLQAAFDKVTTEGGQQYQDKAVEIAAVSPEALKEVRLVVNDHVKAVKRVQEHLTGLICDHECSLCDPARDGVPGILRNDCRTMASLVDDKTKWDAMEWQLGPLETALSKVEKNQQANPRAKSLDLLRSSKGPAGHKQASSKPKWLRKILGLAP